MAGQEFYSRAFVRRLVSRPESRCLWSWEVLGCGLRESLACSAPLLSHSTIVEMEVFCLGARSGNELVVGGVPEGCRTWPGVTTASFLGCQGATPRLALSPALGEMPRAQPSGCTKTRPEPPLATRSPRGALGWENPCPWSRGRRMPRCGVEEGAEHRGRFEAAVPYTSVLITLIFSSLFLLAMSGLVVPPM